MEPMSGGPVWGEAGVDGELLRANVRADVCVVGLGAAGLTAAKVLAERGAAVVGLDSGAIGDGASGRNGGFLLAGLADFHHVAAARLGREKAAATYRLTLDELERVAAQTPAAVRRTGSLRIAVSPEEEADCVAQHAAMVADGLPVEPYEGPEGVGLRFPHDAALQPALRCGLLAETTLAAGARLHPHSPATTIDGGAVTTPQGTVTCDRVIVCVDGGLERLLPELVGTVRTARAQMLATAPTDEIALPAPVYSRWGYDYWQQLEDGRIALGGCRDLGGDAEWTNETRPTPRVQAHLERLLREHLGVTAAVTHRWAGAIGYTESPVPLLAEPRPGVIAAGGYRGTGNVLGPLCGSAAAELALDGASHLAEVLSDSR